MKAELTFNDPGELSATIAITLTLKQWVEVQKMIKDAPYYSAAGEIRKAIDQLASKACDTLRYTPPVEETL